ncbi:MAG TPA: DUF1552 domain-containing protein [Polyangiaceae bacterium]|nr:DUF1552 domain-containing protein [Polyangiaceae bacterium]
MKSNHTGRGLSRRLFLGGSAVAVGLPFFESVMPRVALADATTAAKRLIYFWIPNGVWMDSFRPTTVGAGYMMPPVLAAMEPLRTDFSIVTGLNNQPANPDVIGDHASGTSGFITCAHALKSDTMIHLAASADQLAATGLVANGIKTRIPSMQLGIDGGSSAGGCDSGYSCAYSRNISWADATTPLPKITDALQAFNQIFMGYDSTASAADVAKRQAYDKSVLDYVTADATSLNAKLGKTDQMKLDQYLTGVRALELQLTSSAAMASCVKGTPPGSNPDFPTHVKSMLDTMVLAFQCDATRVISFMLGNAVSQQTYPFLMAAGGPISRGHHDISHHNGDATSIAQLIAINTWTFQQIAYLLTKMKGVPDGTGDTNLLTNSAIFISSDISDGNMHNHDDMPIILAGHGGGALKPGTHIRYGKEVDAPSWKSKPASSNIPVANLLLTMQQSVGVMGAIGDSTGILPEL